MGSACAPSPVKLFCAILYAPGADIAVVHNRLNAQFGPFDHSYGPIDFGYTKYYEEEMGTGLQKSYHTFAGFVGRETLASAKLFTNALEQDFARNGKRTVNVDPGYLSRDKLVLASTKDFFHRIYLSDGIYAEVTLHFRRQLCRHFSWTYPDYRTEGFANFIVNSRETLGEDSGMRKE